ncbi:peroxiredoxin family protein [Formosa undariae]|uniref:Peroxiredoxin family protein n=1 Tax=Formosa undariae TaxID=1325436 RepID=A0ABV5EY82_9FLAO
MKQILLLILGILLIGCKQKTTHTNEFSSHSDRIELTTKKIKGNSLFPAGAVPIYFNDTLDHYEYPVIFPEDLTEIKLATQHVDIKPFQFENLKKDNSDYLKVFLKENYPSHIDTLNLPPVKDNSICMMTGKRGTERIFIIDENNNKDFRDDAIRKLGKMDWETTDQLIKSKYKIFDGEKMKTDSTWVNIGKLKNKILFSVSHHLVSTFSIDTNKYQIGIVDRHSNFGFDRPILALLSENGVKKDSLPKSELLNKGEYLKLGSDYYKFENISNDGEKINLIKQKDVSHLVGTQVGFIAPKFTTQTIDSSTVSLDDYKGEYLVLANLTACYSAISTYQHYKEMTESFQGKISFIGIDNSTQSLPVNIKNLNLSGKFIFAELNNDEIQKHYRQDFSSRTCFLIDKEGHIQDKFEISDWKQSLTRIIK